MKKIKGLLCLLFAFSMAGAAFTQSLSRMYLSTSKVEIKSLADSPTVRVTAVGENLNLADSVEIAFYKNGNLAGSPFTVDKKDIKSKSFEQYVKVPEENGKYKVYILINKVKQSVSKDFEVIGTFSFTEDEKAQDIFLMQGEDASLSIKGQNLTASYIKAEDFKLTSACEEISKGAKVNVKSDSKLEVTFKAPAQKGKYDFTVTCGSKSIKKEIIVEAAPSFSEFKIVGSPLILVGDKVKALVSGENFTSSFVTPEKFKFSSDCDKMAESAGVTVKSDSELEVTFESLEKGNHELTVAFGDKSIKINVSVEAVCSLKEFVLEDSPIKESSTVTALVNGENFNASYVKAEDFKFTSSSKEIEKSAKVNIKSDSQLEVTFTLPEGSGKYNIALTYGNFEVKKEITVDGTLQLKEIIAPKAYTTEANSILTVTVKGKAFTASYVSPSDFTISCDTASIIDGSHVVIQSDSELSIDITVPSQPGNYFLALSYGQTFVQTTFKVGLYKGEEKFVEIPGTVIKGNEKWTPESATFIKKRGLNIKTFYMCSHPVTEDEWYFVMPGRNTKSKRAKTGVSWYDAIVYCNMLSIKAGFTPCYSVNGSTDPKDLLPGENIKCDFSANGYRLPTEAEWEWAARAQESYTYSGSDDIDQVAWYEDNADGACPVEKKSPNAFGLYDMSGNVLEWCYDACGEGLDINKKTPFSGPQSGDKRVLRGGSWYFSAPKCSVATRYKGDPTSQKANCGFRLVRSSL